MKKHSRPLRASRSREQAAKSQRVRTGKPVHTPEPLGGASLEELSRRYASTRIGSPEAADILRQMKERIRESDQRQEQS